jgi:hypothetical protein
MSILYLYGYCCHLAALSFTANLHDHGFFLLLRTSVHNGSIVFQSRPLSCTFDCCYVINVTVSMEKPCISTIGIDNGMVKVMKGSMVHSRDRCHQLNWQLEWDHQCRWFCWSHHKEQIIPVTIAY